VNSYQIFSKLASSSEQSWTQVGETDLNVLIFTHNKTTESEDV